MIPLYGFLEGDTIGLLVLAQPTDTGEDLVAKLVSAAKVRVQPAGKYSLHRGGKEVFGNPTVKAMGLEALDRIDVRRVRPWNG